MHQISCTHVQSGGTKVFDSEMSTAPKLGSERTGDSFEVIWWTKEGKDMWREFFFAI